MTLSPQQQATNDWLKEEVSTFVSDTAADIATAANSPAAKSLENLNLYLRGYYVLDSLAKIDNSDWPDDVKTSIKMLVFATTFSPTTVPASIEITFGEAWDLVHGLPENYQDSLDYLTENFPATFSANPIDGSLNPPAFLTWAGPDPYPGVVPAPGVPDGQHSPIPVGAPAPHVNGPVSDGQQQPLGTPLVLDIDGSGTIELTALNGAGSVYWDIDQDGFAEASGWVTGGDGLLCIDLNSDGTINNNGELFGGTNGYTALAAYDSNSSGTITSADTQFGNLRIWIDSNGDGFSQADELHTLSSLGITSISVSYSNVNYDISGNHIAFQSTFVMNGNTFTSVDAFFAYDNLNTIFVGNYTLDAETLLLPDARGYGTLPDLHIAMSMDTTLKGMVEDFVALDVSEMLASAFYSPSGDIQDIMFRWAGVDGVSPTSRGNMIDARVLGFLEDYVGHSFVQSGNSNPNSLAAGDLTEGWSNAYNAIAGRLILQAGGAAEIFEGLVTYNPVTDAFAGATGINLTGIADLLDDVSGWTGKFNASGIIVSIIDEVLGIANLSSQDRIDLQALFPSGVSLDALMHREMSIGETATQGGSGDDFLIGGMGADTILANGGNDILMGGGSPGTDYLKGGNGNDTYILVKGLTSGQIDETTTTGTDAVRLSGYAVSDIRLWTDGNGWLHVVNKSNSNDHETIYASVTGAAGTFSETTVASVLEQIAFDDGTTWNLSSGLTLEGADSIGTDVLYGSQYNDQISGLGGNDNLYGNRGNDTLIGGSGSDSLLGGVGDDTYVFAAGSGTDAITENASAGTDTYRMTGYATTDLRLWTDSNGYLNITNKANAADNAYILVGTTGFSGTVSELAVPNVEQVVFDNSTTWSLTGGLSLEGTSTTESLYGTQYDDQISGLGGGDILYGNRGNDTLIGGTGADNLIGGAGNDTYVFAAGSGTDAITENVGAGTDTYRMTGYATTDLRLWTDSNGYLNVTNKANAADNAYILVGTTGFSGTINELAVPNIEQIVFDNSTTWSLTGGLSLEGTSTTESLYGTQYDDQISGLGGGDILYGNRGNDTLIGGAGGDNLAGGAGNDTYIFATGSGTDAITENASAGTDTYRMTGYATTDLRLWADSSGYLHVTSKVNAADDANLYVGTTGASGTVNELAVPNVEQVVFDNSTTWSLTGGLSLEGTSSAESLYGTQYDDQISGLDGGDVLYGNRGNDTLTGGTGSDNLIGGAGNDTYIFATGSGTDAITENASAGTDTIRMTGYATTDVRLWTDSSGYLHVTNRANVSDDANLYVGTTNASGTTYELAVPNIEQIVFDNATTWSLTGGLSLEGTSSNESLYGTQYDDQISGLGGIDNLYGNRGNDTLTGGSGNDNLIGGVGNDTYVFASGSGTDAITENASAGTDTVRMSGYATTDVRLWTDSSGYLHVTNKANASDDVTLYGGTTNVSGTTSEFGVPNVEQVVFDDTTTWSLTGALTLEGTSSADSLYGTQYNDILKGMDGADNLYGNRGNDTVYGGNGNDTLNGGAGDDTLYGSAGTDVLYGNAGADTFVFESASAFSNQDTVGDFSAANGDKLDIHDIIDVAFNPATMAIANFVDFVTSGSDAIMKIDLDGTGTTYGWQSVATITGGAGLDETTLYNNGNLLAA